MGRSVIRLFCGVLLTLALCGSAVASNAARPMQAALAWPAKVGGASTDHALQAQTYFPGKLTIAVAGTTAAQTGQDTDPVAVVKALNAAVSRNDVTAARALLDPAFRHLVGPDSTNAQEQGKDQFPIEPLPHVDESNIHQIDANTVEMDITLSGPAMPPLPHPFSFHATFTVKNGLIIQLIDRFSPQTKQNLAALQPPAGAPARMPNTGESAPRAVTVLLALGLLCALAGAAVRRAWLLHR